MIKIISTVILTIYLSVPMMVQDKEVRDWKEASTEIWKQTTFPMYATDDGQVILSCRQSKGMYHIKSVNYPEIGTIDQKSAQKIIDIILYDYVNKKRQSIIN
jgi:hypothetical protein